MESWKTNNYKLSKTIKFSNFREAVAFINQLTEEAEAMNHHPDISLYGYRYLKIDLFTHQKNAITHLDHQLSEKIDELHHLFINNISD